MFYKYYRTLTEELGTSFIGAIKLPFSTLFLRAQRSSWWQRDGDGVLFCKAEREPGTKRSS